MIMYVSFNIEYCACYRLSTIASPFLNRNSNFVLTQKIVLSMMCNTSFLACNKAEVDRNEYKLHCTFSPSTLWFFSCITDIGAHKP